MRHLRFLQFILLTAICLAVSGHAEAGEVSPLNHPEQFPYPDNVAEYSDLKTGCAIQAFENGAFDVYFPGGLGSTSVTQTVCSSTNVSAYLYDPTTMSNTSKKIASKQTSYIDSEIGCSSYQIPISSMTGTADAKKATVTVKIGDRSLQDEIYGPVSIRPQGSINYSSVLMNAGFKLKLGWWTATCSAKRSVAH